MPRLLRCALVLVLALLAGCGTGDDTEPVAVSVTGTAGAQPTVAFDAPLTVTQTSSYVVWPGAGPELVASAPVLLHLYGEDGRDRTVLTNTYGVGGAPRMFTLDDASLGSGMARALRGQHVGARILFEEVDDDVPVVLVIDVLPTRAYGEKVDPAPGFPTVTTDRNGAPAITIPDGAAQPQELAVQPLIRGSGTQVEAGQTITVRYTGVRWSTGEVFDSNWTDPTAAPLTVTAGVGTVIEGWEQGLLEQAVGTQVMLVVPPNLAYGGTDSPLAQDTLVYVVDILDAHSPVDSSNQESP